MPGPPEDAKLKDLRARLAKAKAEQRIDQSPEGSQNGRDMGQGLQLSAELVAGIAVGSFLGWASDHWLGTGPWGLIIGFMLGTAAGFLNVYRTATAQQKED